MQDDKEKFLGFIGILQKNKNLIVGYSAVLKKKRDLKLMILSDDVGESVLRKLMNIAKVENIPLFQIFHKNELAKYTKYQKISVMGITDKKLANSIENKILKIKKI